MATLPETMRAARMHEYGKPLSLDNVPRPSPGPEDVLVRIHACGIVPNLLNVLTQMSKIAPGLGMPLPSLPAIFGLDPAGEVAQVGDRVKNVAVGDRVYVTPMRTCGTCRHCIDAEYVACQYYTFNGYFGFTNKSTELLDRYPWGGLAEYMVAPSYAAVKIPSNVPFEHAARLGYVGTAYAALRNAHVGPESRVLINGASGTLGLGGVITALALGAARILAVARDRELLDRVKAISPTRIEVFSSLDGSANDWARAMTDGEGVDVALDCLPHGAPVDQFMEGYRAVRRGGFFVNAGGVTDPLALFPHDFMTRGMSIVGSNWFSPKQAREMAALAESDLLKLSVFETNAFPLSDVNQALSVFGSRQGGFSNYVICP